jgi:hypothetical protein
METTKYSHYIGSKMCAFEFKPRENESGGVLHFNDRMRSLIGEYGTIIAVTSHKDHRYDTFRVKFENGNEWSYPVSEALQHMNKPDL